MSMDKDQIKELGNLAIGFHDAPDEPALDFSMQALLAVDQSDDPQKRAAVLDVFAEFQKTFADDVGAYQKRNANRLSPIKGDGFVDYYRKLMADLDPAEDEFSIHLTDPDIPPSHAAQAFLAGTDDLDEVPYSTVMAHVPLEWFADHDAEWIALMLDWCNRLKPVKGTIGIAMTTEAGMMRARFREQWPYLARFPGLDDEVAFFEANCVTGKIGSVNWLTILNDELLAGIGGLDDLTSALGDAAKIHKWDGGVLIQAGDLPDIGDRNADLWPTAYCAVNDALRPIRFEDYPNTPMALLNVPEPLDPYEETLRWVRRFDREE
ncbi:type VI immunity family protein [Yoonia sp. SS1-5]|uniref:Type VI immunity family protein n=1 Tax=Yoonia rhodophyticola TaxID=3137370 RepID=A0AAN0MCJ3_9RHOB